MTALLKRLTEDNGSALDRIRRFIIDMPENSRVLEITPEMAAALLKEYNHGNRARKPSNIIKYSAHMDAESWSLTGDTIKFSDAGRLLDGQNRLMACVRSGRSFRTHVVFGIADSAFDVIDRGVNRGGADILKIAGFDNCAVLAGAVRWVHLIASGRAKQRDTIEPDEILRLVQTKYKGLPEYVQQGRAIYQQTAQPITLVVALLYLFHNANKDLAAEFATAWETAQQGGKFRPLGLMQAQIGVMQGASSGRVHDVVRAALIVKAWNLFVTRRKGIQADMRWKLSEAFPEIASS